MLDRSDVGDVHQDSRDGGYDTEDGEESIFVHLLLMFGVDDTLFIQKYKNFVYTKIQKVNAQTRYTLLTLSSGLNITNQTSERRAGGGAR